jgi:hypothetical protein
MATCQAVSEVLLPTVHKSVLYFWFPHYQQKKKKLNPNEP